MPYSIEKTSVFNAPAEKIFDTLLSLDKIIDIYPSLVEIEEAKRLPNGGNKIWWLYKIAGQYLKGTSEDIEVIPSYRITTRISGGIECTLVWILETNENNVWVTLKMDYLLPFKLIGRIGELVARKLGEREAENALINLMFLVEDLESLGR